jgi:3-oxoadipate enol-lactonase
MGALAGSAPLAVSDRGSGPPVVLLHGQPGTGYDWEPVAARLADHLRVLVPDRPGYGRTGGRAVGVAANTELVVDLLDRLQVERAVIGGHSWAGAVALDLAARHADRVGGLVLVGSVGGSGSIDRLDRLLALPLVGPALSMMGMATLRFSRKARQAAHLDWRVGPDVPSPLETGLYRSWRSFVIEQRALVQELPAIATAIAQLEVSAVVVVGERDRVVPPSSQAALANVLPRARLVAIAGVGHLLPNEAPEQLASVIEALVMG